MTEPKPKVVRRLIIYPSGRTVVTTTTGMVLGTRAELKKTIEDIIHALQQTDPTA